MTPGLSWNVYRCISWSEEEKQGYALVSKDYSRCKTTTKPMIPSMAVFIQGCSDSMIVTYPTNGIYPTVGSMVSTLTGGTHAHGGKRTDTADYILSLQIVLALCICKTQLG